MFFNCHVAYLINPDSWEVIDIAQPVSIYLKKEKVPLTWPLFDNSFDYFLMHMPYSIQSPILKRLKVGFDFIIQKTKKYCC